jgi:hypothetical protein
MPERSRTAGARPRLRWRDPSGWKKYERLLRLIRKLDGYQPTWDVLRAAGLVNDPRGGIGALHAASALGLCHARSGGRRSLTWGPGRRPSDETVPKLARETEYGRVVKQLRKAPRAAFPTALLQELAGGRTRQEVVGAMKLLVAAGLVDHVIMRPWTKSHGITCWGWSSSHIRDRYYRGGLGPKESLSFVDEMLPDRDLKNGNQ